MFLFGYILGIMDMNLNNVFFRYYLKGFGQTDRQTESAPIII